MLITNHVLSGALLGAAAPGPASALVGGVASHFVLDSVPHWGEGVIEDFMHVAVTDGLVGLAAIALVARRTPRRHRLRVLAGITGACLPDLDKPGRVFFGRSPFPPAVDAFHQRIQRESARRMPQEVLVALGQAGVLALLARRGQLLPAGRFSVRLRRRRPVGCGSLLQMPFPG